MLETLIKGPITSSFVLRPALLQKSVRDRVSTLGLIAFLIIFVLKDVLWSRQRKYVSNISRHLRRHMPSPLPRMPFSFHSTATHIPSVPTTHSSTLFATHAAFQSLTQ